MSSSKLNFFSIGKTIDGTSYCSGVETLAENIIEDNEKDAVLVFPSKNGWVGVRSSSYKMTTESVVAELPSPIYKIKRFLLKPFTVTIKVTYVDNDGFTNVKDFPITLKDFKNSKGEFFELDITDMIVTEEERNALPISKTNDELKDYNCKDNTFSYKQGSTTIAFDSTVYEHWLGVDKMTKPVYHQLLWRLKERIGDIATKAAANGDPYKYVHDVSGESAGSAYIGSFLNGLIYGPKGGAYDPRDFQYRIEYVPLTSKTKIRARKTAKQEVEYLQPFNQRAEINAASAFGKNMWLTAQKTGTEQITVVKNYTKLNDIPPVGAVVRHNGKRYRLVANSYKQTNTIYLQVTHTLSENWTSKSKHVSVNQKYRNYNIPQDMLWRNMYWEDYIVVNGAGLNGDSIGSVDIGSIMQLFTTKHGSDKTIDCLCWMFEGNETNAIKQIGATVPCSTYGIANSIVISASFKDNLSAGLKITENKGEENDKEYLCEETLYCNEDGTLESARVILTDGIGNGSYTLANGLTENNTETLEEDAKKLYPAICSSSVAGYTDITVNAPKTALFNRKFYIDKDAGEALKFTYQVHFVTEDDCVVGNKIAENNPLIKRYEKARQYKVWLLKSHIREGVDKLETTDNDKAYSQINNGEYFVYFADSEGKSIGRVALKDAVKEELQSGGYKAWAITDENNHLYVGRNENQEGIVHLCISHKRN